ncbi:hypothetical protein [Streptomyces silvisoli]|uniref:DUF1003 domain-containing protein n=1 Tax=Streptomyces silvisoli TaxID=3034235 RepID=A0ABT5ZEA4_9ACTN|nr:hypothetical protein [Streptomyces silvisoli]MDF3288011.1 hypothetical protein [Streptomyces silvisoli]
MSTESGGTVPTVDEQPTDPGMRPVESLTGIAHPAHAFDRILAWVPRALASKVHVIFLVALGIYLVVLPLAHILTPSATAELIGGNYTNVTSDVGACVAAGGTLHLVRTNRRRSRMEEERLRLARETHRLLHHVHADQARGLGHDVPELDRG